MPKGIHIARHLKSSLHGRDLSKKKGSEKRSKKSLYPVMKTAKADGHRTSLINSGASGTAERKLQPSRIPGTSLNK